MHICLGAPLPHAPSHSQLGAFAFLILFASVIALISFIQVVRSFSPSVASTFAYVNPVVGILLGWLVLGEIPAPLSLAGMAVVLISIALFLKQIIGGASSAASSGTIWAARIARYVQRAHKSLGQGKQVRLEARPKPVRPEADPPMCRYSAP